MVLLGAISVASGSKEGIVLLGTSLVLGALAFGLAWPVTYTLAERELIVRFGLARIRIAYGVIDHVSPTNNPLSSPAWSLRRLSVSYGRRRILISPADRGAFLRDLAERDPTFQLEGDRLLRKGASR